ncbi:transmembrane protein 272-like isoform X2 [Thrips palmi]|nr:transmembrane protein 272-like isoform X2 [Thrips palmi]
MEYADGENTPDSNKMNRKLSHIKKRVSQEFTKSSKCRKWVTWLIHLVGVTVPYAAILVGAIYLDECPANRNIPMHLIVTGVVTAVLHLSTSIDAYRKLSYLKDDEKPAIFTLTSLFLFIWMILGCVWVFGIFVPDNDYGMWNPQGFGYCHKRLYWFAFVFNLAFLVSVVASFLLCCCVCNLLCNITILTCLCYQKTKKGHGDEDASTPVQV